MFKPYFLISIIVVILSLCALKACASPPLNETNAIQTIVGEASNQGYQGMLGVANVIRHRNSLKGFYGFEAMKNRHEPDYVWVMARRAWIESETHDVTLGATHFENIHSFGEPRWAKGMIKTVTIKDHQFYKEKH